MSRYAAAVSAIRAGDLGELERQLDGDSSLLAARDEEGHTLLLIAADAATGDRSIPLNRGSEEHHRAVDLLLQRGVSHDGDPDGWTPLHSAAMSGHGSLARTLVAGGAPRDARLWGLDGGTPLALGLFYAHDAIADALGDPPAPNNLRIAASLGHAIAPFFDAAGALTDAARSGRAFYRPIEAYPEWAPSEDRGEILDEALTWAARNGRVGSMEALVARGARLDGNPYRGTPLLWAGYANRVEAVRWLLEHGADPNQRHDFGGEGHGGGATAMHLASQLGSLDSLRLMLEAGGDPTITDELHDGDVVGWAYFVGNLAAADVALEFMDVDG